MYKPTKSQVEEYLNQLHDPYDLIKTLYRTIEETLLTLSEDTSEDNFQIAADLLEIFYKKTAEYQEMKQDA